MKYRPTLDIQGAFTFIEILILMKGIVTYSSWHCKHEVMYT